MRRFFNYTIVFIALSYVAATAATLAAQAKAPAKNPVAPTAKSIADGESLFQKNCRFCHGADAKGDGPQAPKDTHPPNLVDAKWDHGSTDAELFSVIKDGVGPKFNMKGYNSKMTPNEMWSIINYLRSIGTKDAAR